MFFVLLLPMFRGIDYHLRLLLFIHMSGPALFFMSTDVHTF